MTNVLLQPPVFIDALEYAPDPTGVNDSTTALQNAINAAAGGITNGTNTVGAAVIIPGGTYLVSGLILYSFVHLIGHGPEATIIKLKNGANADVVQGYNAPALIGTNNTGGIVNWGVYNLTIDGNKSNQSGTSYGLRQYGYGFRMENVRIRNCYTDPFYSDWNGGGTAPGFDQMESYITNCKFHDSNGIGVNFHGPHDSVFTDVHSFRNGSHMFYIGPNAGGTQFTACHGWAGGTNLGTNSVSWLIESLVVCVNCAAEGSDVVEVAMLANNCLWIGGRIFSGNTNGNNVTGLQIGQIDTAVLKSGATTSPITLTANPTTIAAAAFLQFVVSGAGAAGTISVSGTNIAGGAINDNLSPSGNGTYVTTNAYSTISSITWTGLTGASITVNGLGLPYAGSSKQSGGVTLAMPVSGYFVDCTFAGCEGSNGAIWFAKENGNGHIRGLVNLNQSGDPGNANVVSTGSFASTTHYALIPNGATADGTIGKGGRFAIPIKASKALLVGDGTQDIFNFNTFSKRSEWVNGAFIKGYSDNYSTTTFQLDTTLSTFGSTTAPDPGNGGTITTAGVGVARITPSANETGGILQAGTRDTQQLTVVNKSASFSFTFAASGTSHVAGGTGVTVAANSSRLFFWDAAASLWY